MKELKKGDVRKIVCTEPSFKCIGIVANNDGEWIEIITSTGQIRECRVSKIESAKAVRINPQLRAALKNALNVKVQVEDLDKQLAECKVNLMNKKYELSNTLHDIVDFSEEVDAKTFEKIFWESLDSRCRTTLENYGFEPSYLWSGWSSDEHVRIMRTHDIEKYCRRSNWSFIEEEYDGCLFIVHDAEKDRNYKRLCNNCRKNISLTNAKMDEGLSIGDKDWLTYFQSFNIPIKGELTRTNAKKLATKVKIK